MERFPADTCVMCDLPWKNNRVSYDGQMLRDLKTCVLSLGGMQVSIDHQGVITGKGAGGETLYRLQTGFVPNECTMAFDSLYHMLYFSSGNQLVAFSLDEGKASFTVAAKGAAGSPLLFEWLLPGGDMQLAVGFADAGSYIVCDRITGKRLWRAQTLGVVADAAAHWQGYLYMTLKGDLFQVLCMEAANGDLVWWNRGRGEPKCGIVCNGAYCVHTSQGKVQRFALEDGEGV